MDFTVMGRLAVILGQNPPAPGVTEPPMLNSVLGALVEIVEQKEETFVVRYLRAVSVIGAGTPEDIAPQVPFSDTEKEEKKLIFRASRTNLRQKWLISRRH
jgi:hypothetical protein